MNDRKLPKGKPLSPAQRELIRVITAAAAQAFVEAQEREGGGKKPVTARGEQGTKPAA